MKFYKNFDRFVRIILSEWRSILTDPAVMLIAVVGVLLYAFYYPLPYTPQLARKAPAAVVDEDKSAMSRELIRMCNASDADTIIRVFNNEEDAKKALGNEEIYGYLKIPFGFESDLRSGKNVSLGAYLHGGFLLLYGNLGTAFATAAGTLGAQIQVKRLIAKKEAFSVNAAMVKRDPISARYITMFNGALGYGVYVVPSVLMLVLQQTCLIAIGSMGGARKNRRFKMLKNKMALESAPFLTRYFGRFFAFLFHYLVAVYFYKFIVYHIFEIPDRGNDLYIFIFACVFFWAVINLGMCTAQFFFRRETGIPIFACLPIFILFISGFSWPLRDMPTWLQAIGAFFPSTHAIPAWLALENMGAELYEVSGYLYKLFFLGLFYFVLALLLSKRHDLKGE